MNRRDLIRNAILSAGALGADLSHAQQLAHAGKEQQRESYPLPARSSQGEPMPNILWICTDQQRFDTLQGLSNSVIRTPNLKRLMNESVTFTNAFCQTPICSPSRGSFLSGRYPHVTGLRANGQRIRESERLVTRILADYGYTCGLVGKLHLSPCYGGRVEDRIDDGYQVFEWSHDTSNSWPLHNQWYTWLDRQGIKIPKAPKGPVWGMPIDPKYTQTAWCAEVACDFIRQQREFNPWLMSVNIFAPHHPFHPTEEYLSHYDPAKMPHPAYREGELDHKNIFQQQDHQSAYGGHDLSFTKTSAEQHQQITAAYYAMIEEVDTQVGRMLQALDETGQAENTIVIFMSDHGEMLGDHGIYLKGPYFYDCLTRVPLIVRWPGRFKTGSRVDGLVELVDIAPTLLELAGIPPSNGMQGRSLVPLLEGSSKGHRDSVYMEFFDANSTYPVPPMLTGVRTDRWKLSLVDRPRSGEMYDLLDDPGEVSNLWSDPHHQDTREMLLQQLVARMIETVDPLPVRHTPW